MKAFLLLLALTMLQFGAMNARASAIPNHPGWKLEKIAKEEKAEEPPAEGVAFEYADFFALYPNDARPPITVDGGTASRILNGQANPETIYFNRMMGENSVAKQNAESGSGGGVGWQVAESTYVPLGEERSRQPSTITSIAGGNRSGASSMPTSGTTSGGGASFSSGFGAGSGGGISAAPTASVSIGSSATASSGSGSFSGGMVAKPVTPANGSTAAAANADTGNMTYSQMIDAAMGNASTSLCGRMGQYAAAGQCGR